MPSGSLARVRAQLAAASHARGQNKSKAFKALAEAHLWQTNPHIRVWVAESLGCHCIFQVPKVGPFSLQPGPRAHVGEASTQMSDMFLTFPSPNFLDLGGLVLARGSLDEAMLF